VADIIRAEQPDVVYVETLSNPLVKVIDLDAISAAAQEVGAVSVVDSTFTTPYLVRPIEHGFDLVVHSATNYLGGHADSTAGVVISAKNSLLDLLRSYATILGAILSPFESRLVMRGLKTLSLRMERHCSNALQVARFLQEHAAVAYVHYPGLPIHPQHTLATSLLGSGRYGGLLSFELKEQTREAAFRFMNKLQLCLPATTLGDIYSLVSYPPISSHRDLTGHERQSIGITEGCIRLSVGIEDVNDIIQDLDQALMN
jgi:cystathionine gamma-synthase/methionine-gamma-lyase